MADSYSKPEQAITQEQDTRHYTVGYVPNGGYSNPAPAINLKGRWLEKAGFTRGTPIIVTIVNGHLVISPLPRQSLLNNIMHKVEHLSEEGQRQLVQIINGLVVQEQQEQYQREKKA